MQIEKKQNKPTVKLVTITADNEGQRVDNFLINHLKGVPKSRIYRIIRKGEVRVNKKRIAASYHLLAGDTIRIPPVSVAERAKLIPPSEVTTTHLKDRIIYEDDNLIIINKPSGMAVHGGSTVRIGVVEALRYAFPKLVHLELVHRLDSETSGCLILAKKKRILREIHGLLREGLVKKIYWALTQGKWKRGELRVDVPLLKHYQEGGKHVVRVSDEGKNALTLFRPLEVFANASLVEAKLMTGRTHQIRVHAKHQGHPIAGDDRYGNPEFNKYAHQLGLKRMFLHAHSIDFTLPSSGQRITVLAPLEPELELCLTAFKNHDQ